MTRVVVIDDWQLVVGNSTNWSPLGEVTEVAFYQKPFSDEDNAARNLTDFEIILTMRERSSLPG
jgi:hypothetical protein